MPERVTHTMHTYTVTTVWVIMDRTTMKTFGTPAQDVLRLVGHISKTNRNIMTDFLFSCLEVFDMLTEKGLTL
jgi:hypothetical protein